MTSMKKKKYEFNENLSTEFPFLKRVNHKSKTCTECILLLSTMGPIAISLTT